MRQNFSANDAFSRHKHSMQLTLPLNLIDPPKILVRPIYREEVEYKLLVASVSDTGVLVPILVRSKLDGRYEILDGFNRFSAAQDVGIANIPCNVRECSDREALELQLKAQHHIPMKRTDVARHLIRINAAYPDMSAAELARRAGKQIQWVKDQLSLLTLNERMQNMVDRGEIGVMNAYELARLPIHFRDEFLDNAVLMSREEFKQEVSKRVSQLLTNFGTKRAVHGFTSHPYARNFTEVLRDQEKACDSSYEQQIINVDFVAFDAGWQACIDWVTCMDTQTLDRRRQEYANRLHSRIERKKNE